MTKPHITKPNIDTQVLESIKESIKEDINEDIKAEPKEDINDK